MHEYSLMQGVIGSINRELSHQKVGDTEEIREVLLKVGALELHSEESFRQAFQALAQGTRLEKANLNLSLVPPELLCGACGYRGALKGGGLDTHDPLPAVPCPACGKTCLVTGGRGVESIQLVVEKKR